MQRWLFLLALLGVALGTAGGAVVARREEDHDAERVADAVADQAAASVQGVLERAVGALEGTGALVDTSGDVDREAFRAYGEGLESELLFGVGLGLPVDGADRATFEQDVAPITRRRAGGSFAPAPVADVYEPIVDIVSTDPVRRRVLGFDYASDPARSAALDAARDSGEAALSPPTQVGIVGQTGFVVIQPLYRRGASLTTPEARQRAYVGYVSTAYGVADFLAALERELGSGTGITIVDDGVELLDVGRDPSPDRPARRRAIEVPGRTWSLTVVSPDKTERTLSNAVVVGGSIGGVVLLLVFLVTFRYQRRLRRSYALQHQAQQRSAVFEGLADRLSQSLSSAEVADALLHQLPPFTGTTAGAVLVVDDDGQHLNLLAADGYGPDQLLEVQQIDLETPSALADAVLRAEPVWLPSPLSWRGDPVTTALGQVGRAVAIVPLVADRRVAGVLVLVHPGVRSFYEEERSSLTTVAALAARALNRAQRYDVEHDAAVVLQRALLPAVIPKLPDVSVAVRYLPATGGLAVGGDWYDTFPLDDGRSAVAVGDVVGRGVKAAAAMGRLRSAMRALAEVRPEPAALLQAFEAHVPTIPDALCATMIYGVVDPVARTFTFVRAGHPPPLLLRQGAEPQLIDGVVLPPLGVTGGATPQASTVALDPGDTIVLYTDGVVERRGEPVTAGLERLRAIGAKASGLDPEACCDVIVQAQLGDEGHGDDAAVVAVRLSPAPAASESVAGPVAPTVVR